MCWLRHAAGVAVLGGALARATLGCSLLYSADAISGSAARDGETDAPVACDPSFVFCDGFEDGLGKWTPAGATVTVDDAHQAHRGKRTLHAQFGATTDDVNATVRHLQSYPPHMYVRFFVYLPSPLRVSANLLTLVTTNGDGATIYVRTDGTVATSIFRKTPDLPSSIRPSPDAWACIEVDLDRAGQALVVAVDGRPVYPAAQSTLGDLTADLNLDLGLASAAPTAGYEAWFDDVAVAASPIGCGR